MRRLISRVVLLGLLATSVLVVPVAAQAHPVAAPAASVLKKQVCPHPKPYPPSPHATVQSSTTHPRVGQHIEASGIHYCPNEDVTITIGGHFVGTGHTNGVGTFDPDVIVPGPTGQKLLCGIGASGLSRDRDCLTLFVQGSGTSGQGGGGGGTSFTGVEIGAMIAVAIALLVGGVVFARAGARRKQSIAG
jgi:hypothetical protein